MMYRRPIDSPPQRHSALPLRLGVGVVLCLCLLALSAPPADPTLYFTTNLPDPSPPDQETALLADLSSATPTSDAALYEFDRPSIRDALLAAYARGVTVCLVTDGAARLEDAATWDVLTAAGIQVDHRPASRATCGAGMLACLAGALAPPGAAGHCISPPKPSALVPAVPPYCAGQVSRHSQPHVALPPGIALHRQGQTPALTRFVVIDPSWKPPPAGILFDDHPFVIQCTGALSDDHFEGLGESRAKRTAEAPRSAEYAEEMQGIPAIGH